MTSTFEVIQKMMWLFIIMIFGQCSGTKQPLRVYGGEDAGPETYPYVVRLEMRMSKLANGTFNGRNRHVCTASALSPTWAVTAAHCLVNLNEYVSGLQYEKFKLVIRHGSVNSSFNNKNSFSDVLSMIPHPRYVYNALALTTGHLQVKNDIGLTKTTPMPLKTYMKLSAVDFRTMYGHEAIFAGFGITPEKISDAEVIFGTTLKLKKPLQIFKVGINKCMLNVKTEPSLCLANRCGTIATTCGGDSGGPVIHSSGIIAVSSSGFSTIYCADSTFNDRLDVAAVTCPVGPFIEWITSYVRI